MKRPYLISTFFVLTAPLLLGCGGADDGEPAPKPAETQQPATTDPAPVTPDIPAEPSAEASPITTEEQLKAALKARNPGFLGEAVVHVDERGIFAVEIHDPAVEDISPLAGLPLQYVDFSRSHVSDLSPLKGAKLTALYLEETGVKDISMLRGMPLVSLYLTNTRVSDISALKGLRTKMKELNLIGTDVTDLSPLEGMDIEMIWLSECPISDLGPLQNVRVVSLTVADTKVSDLTPLKGHPTLQRLHIARTAVTDLSPLQWMNLTRLIFTPNRIKTGIEHAREMPGLREIGIDFEQRLPPPQFWPRYDAGRFK